MTRTGAWRIPAAYRYALDLDDADFAWEFLRRNPEFRHDADRAAESTPATSPPGPQVSPGERSSDPKKVRAHCAGLPARWGLHFRTGPHAARRQSARAALAA